MLVVSKSDKKLLQLQKVKLPGVRSQEVSHFWQAPLFSKMPFNTALITSVCLHSPTQPKHLSNTNSPGEFTLQLLSHFHSLEGALIPDPLQTVGQCAWH